MTIEMSDRVLVLAPHTDDGEIGCGATLSRFVEEGKTVFYVAFSAPDKGLPPGYPPDALRKEVQEATKILGIPAANLRVLDFPVREFPLHRQAILDQMIRLGKEIAPDLVYLPSSEDTHQDHQTVCQEGFRAFKETTLLGYELPWNNLSFRTTAFVLIDETHLTAKIEALKCYRSQSDRLYANATFIRSLARTRGTQIGHELAEAFDVIRWVIR